jgi:hypothetical protein
LDPGNATDYVLLLKNMMLLTSGIWVQMLNNRERKGCEESARLPLDWSDWGVHTFVVDDQGSPQISIIHAEFQRLSGQKHDVGYVPNTKFVMWRKIWYFIVLP